MMIISFCYGEFLENMCWQQVEILYEYTDRVIYGDIIFFDLPSM